MQTNLYNNKGILNDKQSIYDSFNNFVMSEDRNVFFKMAVRADLYHMSRDVQGDIVECGVFKGAGVFQWLKLLDLYEPHSIKKVVGFDFFDSGFVDNLTDTVDRDTMKQVFSRDSSLTQDVISIESITDKIVKAGFKTSRFDLVKGDISETSANYIKDKPGFRISLLYLDIDLDQPTYDTLVNLWDRVVPGGVVVFDEYAYHCWSEANAVDRFFKDKRVSIINTNIQSPTAYIIKD